MTRKVHYFNPGHEAAILLGVENYTAPANVQRMTKELSLLPVWYAEADDYVLVDDTPSPSFLSRLPKELAPFALPVEGKNMRKKLAESVDLLEAAPWGLSPHSIALFERLKMAHGLKMEVPFWKEAYKQLAGRQTAAACLDRLHELLPGLPLPVSPRFCTTMREIEKYMILCNPPYVLKTPYSSSGRGLHWMQKRKPVDKDKTWINGAFNKQGTVSIECGLDKVQDFAMEFYSDGKGQVCYLGLSLFGTGDGGAYSGNVLQNQEALRTMLAGMIGGENLQQVQEAVCQVLQETYGCVYTGYLGVDMLVYKGKNGKLLVHPCVEINMRYTMGLVALRLFQKYIVSDAIGDFRVSYDNKPGEALEHHHFMREAYPLVLEGGKVKEGYLSLCPVTKDTRYRAYLLII